MWGNYKTTGLGNTDIMENSFWKCELQRTTQQIVMVPSDTTWTELDETASNHRSCSTIQVLKKDLSTDLMKAIWKQITIIRRH